MKQYLELLQTILDKGVDKNDRTGVGTRSLFGYQMRMNLQEGFPLLTTKKVYLRGIIHELLWLLRGETNIKYLVDNDVRIWNEWPFQSYLKKNNLEAEFPKYSEGWAKKLEEFIGQIKADAEFAKKWGELGPVYGQQWRCFKDEKNVCFDQIAWVVNEIKKNPDSRRLIVTAWHASKIEEMAKSGLPPCHMMFQFYVANGRLSCQMYQRSADTFLGVPFNIASYSLLTLMMAQATGLQPGDFVHTFGDVHIYKNHFEQVKKQLAREPRPLPTMKLNPAVKDIFAFKFEDFTLENYNPHPPIKASVAV